MEIQKYYGPMDGRRDQRTDIWVGARDACASKNRIKNIPWTEDKPYFCVLCNLSFNMAKDLKMHKDMIHHNGKKPHSWNQCGLLCTSSAKNDLNTYWFILERSLLFAHSAITPADNLVTPRHTWGHIQGRNLVVVASVTKAAQKLLKSRHT